MSALYKATAVSTGGRDGKVYVENSPLAFEMALPKELGGGKKEGVNPEQLFASGYSACYGSALQLVISRRKLNLAQPDVHLTVGIGDDGAGGFLLEADIHVVFHGGIEQDAAEMLAQEAHQVCPYSKATRGNIEVRVSASVE